jgi:hypothetical protein
MHIRPYRLENGMRIACIGACQGLPMFGMTCLPGICCNLSNNNNRAKCNQIARKTIDFLLHVSHWLETIVPIHQWVSLISLAWCGWSKQR